MLLFSHGSIFALPRGKRRLMLSCATGSEGPCLRSNNSLLLGRTITMDALARTIDTAVRNSDYAVVGGVFSYGPSSWQSVGQGEQRSLAAHFIKAIVASPTFLPKAFSSGQMMHVMLEALSHLPSTVEDAADNTLRQKIFDYKVNVDGDYSEAAKVLAGMRMEDDLGSVYYTDPASKCDGRFFFTFLFVTHGKLTLDFAGGFSLCKDRRMLSRGRRNCRIRLGSHKGWIRG